MSCYLSLNRYSLKSVRRASAGFTLVEGIVAALISALLAGVLLAILRMNNSGVKDGAVNAKVQVQYETAIAEIAANARKATAVLGNAEAFPPAAGLTPLTTPQINMYYQDAAGNVTQTRGFWVDGGQLKEWRNDGNGWRLFVVGAWPTLSVPDAAPFTLSSNRRTVTVSMRVTGTFMGDTALAPARGEVFTCRN